MVPHKQQHKTRRSDVTGIFVTYLERAMDKVSTEEQGISVHAERFSNLKLADDIDVSEKDEGDLERSVNQ